LQISKGWSRFKSIDLFQPMEIANPCTNQHIIDVSVTKNITIIMSEY